MSPEFEKFEKILKNIANKWSYALDIQCEEDTRESQGEIEVMVLYVNHNNEEYEYHWFRIPRRERIIFDIKLMHFMEYMFQG